MLKLKHWLLSLSFSSSPLYKLRRQTFFILCCKDEYESLETPQSNSQSYYTALKSATVWGTCAVGALKCKISVQSQNIGMDVIKNPHAYCVMPLDNLAHNSKDQDAIKQGIHWTA